MGERPQERAQRGRSPDLLEGHRRGGVPQSVGVIDAVGARAHRRDQRHHLGDQVGAALLPASVMRSASEARVVYVDDDPSWPSPAPC
ncbi:hypothetical protein [Actinomadura miaoliensis]|uniref:hypothetical protein n=1 Tax=Actinomadura miaoliensis TaxID=430685 RepID=UPI0031EDDF1D